MSIQIDKHASWPGTVSISARTLYSIVRDVADSLRQSGIERLVLVNGHGGNYVLANVVQEHTAARGPKMSLFPLATNWALARKAAGMTTDGHTDMHAAELCQARPNMRGIEVTGYHDHNTATRTGCRWPTGDTQVPGH